MPGGFACDSDTFQVGFHAEHLFLESMGEIASQFEDTRAITYVIIWLAPRAGKMNQILHCDWLPERARWSHRACPGLPT